MNSTIKKLIEKNNQAYKNHYRIESVHLSYIIIVKLMKHLCLGEKNQSAQKSKLGEVIKIAEAEFESNLQMRKKIKHSTLNLIKEFNDEFKALNKELKFQYPDLKLEKISKKGMHIVMLLHTNTIKHKNNKS